MKKYKALAFTFEKKINKSKVIGNPATIFILNEREVPITIQSVKLWFPQSSVTCWLVVGNFYFFQP